MQQWFFVCFIEFWWCTIWLKGQVQRVKGTEMLYNDRDSAWWKLCLIFSILLQMRQGYMRLQAMIRSRILTARFSVIRGWALSLQVKSLTNVSDRPVLWASNLGNGHSKNMNCWVWWPFVWMLVDSSKNLKIFFLLLLKVWLLKTSWPLILTKSIILWWIQTPIIFTARIPTLLFIHWHKFIQSILTFHTHFLFLKVILHHHTCCL